MVQYFEYQYAGHPFQLFGTPHLLTVLVLAFFAWAFLRVGMRAADQDKAGMRVGLALFLMALELATNAWWAYHGAWTLQYMLPLQLCTLMTWVMGFAFVTDTRRLYPLIYFLGVGGAIQAIITPDAGVFGYPHFRFFDAMLSHAGLVLGGLWIVVVERVRPSARSLGETLLALNAYALLIYFVNRGLGSNYLYVNAKPEIASVMDFMPGWPWYVPILELMALALFSALYLPFYRRSAPPAA
jgi:hypothetical integral membrane protein (TIGR02206 family)